MSELLVNNRRYDLLGIDPQRSLLQVLREDLHLTGTKEGCGTGDCGACTVVSIDYQHQPPIIRTLNSCITPLGAVIGLRILTCEGLACEDKLHPVQQAMVDHHGSQCGFCTPGFVMSLVGRQLQVRSGDVLGTQSKAEVIRSISGNLCRCTGYRPIITAAESANATVAQYYPLDASDTLPKPAEQSVPATHIVRIDPEGLHSRYVRPENLAQLDRAINNVAENAEWAFVAGSTDLWLGVTQNYRRFDQLIDLGGVSELRGIHENTQRITIGAATTHAELLDYCERRDITALIELLHRFGSPQVRARGTIGGNIANASPIADWPPILLALDAQLTIAVGAGATRQIRAAEFYRGYKDIDLAPTDYLHSIEFDAPTDWQQLVSHKISKREDDDISSVLGAFLLVIEDGTLTRCRIAYGGIAATPIRLPEVEALLIGTDLSPQGFNKADNQTRIEQALESLASAVKPLSDVRASADYRRAMCVNLLRNALRDKAAQP